MAKDINITIGAEDQATAILRKVEQSTKELTKSVDRMGQVSAASTKMFSVGFKSLVGVAAGVTAAVGAIKGITSAIAGMGSSVEAFNTQEEAARGMTQAQQDFAAAMQRATNVGDESTLMLMRQAEMMGFTKDQSQDVTTAAIGLSEALGIGQTEALKKVSQAMTGNAGALGEFLPALRNATTESEKLAIINETVNAGLTKLNEDSQTTRGAMERAAGAFGDLQEKIGALLEPLFKVTYQGLAVFAETMQVALIPAIQAVNASFAVIPITFNDVAKKIVAYITAIEVALTNLPLIFEMTATALALRSETMRANLEHVFTVALPAYIKWFGENGLNLLQDYFNLYLTVVTNFGEKLGNFFSTIFDFISSGFEGGASALASKLGESLSGSLIEGFEAKTEPLPEIAARELTGAEQELSADLARMGIKLATDFSSKFNERIGSLGLEESPTVDLQFTNPETVKDLDRAAKSIASLQANEQRLLNRGASEDPNKMVAENTKRTNEKLDRLPEKIAANLAPIVNNGQGTTVQFVEVA